MRIHQKTGQTGILGFEQVNQSDESRLRIFTIHDGLPGFFGVADSGRFQQRVLDKGAFFPAVDLPFSLDQIHRRADDARQIVHQ